MKKEKRFERVFEESTILESIEILVDTKTGVNYLYVSQGSGGGVTPLLDREGKVLVTPVSHTVKGPEL